MKKSIVAIVLGLTLTGSVWAAEEAKKEKPVDPCVVEAQKGDKAKLEAALAKCTADAAEAAKKSTAPKPAPKS